MFGVLCHFLTLALVGVVILQERKLKKHADALALHETALALIEGSKIMTPENTEK